ncbi:MAG TPA: hypothetical protein VFX51_12365 [Solirubrobacteraceae bacterium]|nr:hypothetical protein [Solirubrobacteraceae bacterium]
MLGALIAPASALAAAPTITTGRVTKVTPTSAVLHGKVDPNGTATSYIFDLGPTKLYGARSPVQSAGSGNKAVSVRWVVVAGLAPATTYHYRLVGIRGNKTFFGKDRTFKTDRQPLGVSLAATPNPIRMGRHTTLAGTLSGTGNAGRRVQLQANPWPYAGFLGGLVNDQFTTATGSFSFFVPRVDVNTQYRVLMPAKPNVVSPIVVLGTVSHVTRHAKVKRGDRRARIRFTGRIRPALDGAAVEIQKLRKGNWTNIAQTNAVHTNKGYSRYSKRIRQKHGGRYRVVVIHGAHAPTVSRSIRLRHLRD